MQSISSFIWFYIFNEEKTEYHAVIKYHVLEGSSAAGNHKKNGGQIKIICSFVANCSSMGFRVWTGSLEKVEEDYIE